MIKKCEVCGKDMQLKTVGKKGAKNYGELIAIHKNKKFCSTECQNKWQQKITWEERVGSDTAERIRKETSVRVSGEKNPTHNPEIAKKVSESLKKYLKDNPDERLGEKNGFYGKKHTDEFKKYAKESRKGKYVCTEEQYQKKLANQRYGENHHFWNGGTSFEPYSPDFNNKLKRKIKDRDKYVCSICGKETQKLAIHHIDYDKLNSNEMNLISLCYNCHSKTNSKREHWKKFFISIINERYDNLTDEK
jgi:hypothetical protein